MRALLAIGIFILLFNNAQAFGAVLESQNYHKVQENVSLIGKFIIEKNELVPVDGFAFFAGKSFCKFDNLGNEIIGCDGINVDAIQSPDKEQGNLSGNFSNAHFEFGKGEGYKEGIFEFNITINNTLLKVGNYSTIFGALKNQASFNSSIKEISVYVPGSILSQANNDDCLLEGESLTVNGNIIGDIRTKIVEYGINGIYRNISILNNNHTFYNLTNGKLDWHFIIIDVNGGVSKGEIVSQQIWKRTKVIIDPYAPDGLEGWYITRPLFNIISDNGSASYYRWNGEFPNLFTGQFGIEGAPNNANLTGGLVELKFLSEICGEEENNITLKLDFTSPRIKNIKPPQNSIVYNTSRPLISAIVEDVYAKNSGIDSSSILMKIDGNGVRPIITNESDSLIVEYFPVYDLNDGEHTAEITAKDNAGHQVSENWRFKVESTIPLLMKVNSPLDGSLYGERKVIFNISATKPVTLSYYYTNGPSQRETVLCRNCLGYGDKKKQSVNIKEDLNEIVFVARDGFGNIQEESRLIKVDSKKPVINDIKPRKQFTNGTDFSIKYSENNLEAVELYIGNKKILFNCEPGIRKECTGNVDLREFDGTMVDFYFIVRDEIKNVTSRKNKIIVDTTSPAIDVFSPINNTAYPKKFPVAIRTSEVAQIDYFDVYERNPRWKVLCSKCNDFGYSRVRTLYLNAGPHTIIFRAQDNAGNSAIIEREILLG